MARSLCREVNGLFLLGFFGVSYPCLPLPLPVLYCLPMPILSSLPYSLAQSTITDLTYSQNYYCASKLHCRSHSVYLRLWRPKLINTPPLQHCTYVKNREIVTRIPFVAYKSMFYSATALNIMNEHYEFNIILNYNWGVSLQFRSTAVIYSHHHHHHQKAFRNKSHTSHGHRPGLKRNKSKGKRLTSQLLWRVSSLDSWFLDKAHDSAAPCRRTDKTMAE